MTDSLLANQIQNIMKTQLTITELTKENLVDLFSTAFYGSNYLSADYEESIEHDEEDCHEEIMANILLNGGKIFVTDHYAEDGEVYGNLHCRVSEADEDGVITTTYFVTLTDIIKGLEKAANGTFNAGRDCKVFTDWRERNLEFARRSFNAFAFDESEWDLTTADCLMQIILFDEIVYG